MHAQRAEGDAPKAARESTADATTSRAHERADPRQHRSDTNEQPADRSALLDQQALARDETAQEAHQRMLFRSSATTAAASSTLMNINDTVTATTTANVFRGVRLPCSNGSAPESAG